MLTGLEEHWGTLDPDKNPDLDDIARAYGHGRFLVAECDGEIVGTGALLLDDGGYGRIVRMSVAQEKRRQGVAAAILNELCRLARQSGCTHLTLETTATWTNAIQFYLNNGFTITHHAGDNVYFRRNLPANSP
ncbi:MAG TPA: N-acetyltransferase [Anaerolineae bacterium]|nr:N-acetyltransferase [Anaerolineae bacterium]HIP71095.1 N-acetyltransferase [Anaerolineae bacterium]